MKWLATFLLVANVAAYLLVGERQTTSEGVGNNAVPDVNLRGMLLLAEVDTAQQDGATGSLNEPGQSAENAANQDSGEDSREDGGEEGGEDGGSESGNLPDEATAEAGDSVSGSSDQATAAGCYRLGPFPENQNWQAANTWMNENGFGFRHVTSGSRQVLAYRVYLGPFGLQSQADAMVENLKSSDLKHFPYKADNGLVRISMGFFSQEELAKKYQDELRNHGYEAKFRTEYRSLGPLNWMEIESANIERARLSGHDWNEAAVRLIPVDCPI